MNLHHQHRSKKAPRRLLATKQLGLRRVLEGQVRTPPGDTAPRVRGARTRRADPPPGPQPAPHHCAEKPALPPRPALQLAAGFGRPAATATAKVNSSAGDASPATKADPAARSGVRKV